MQQCSNGLHLHQCLAFAAEVKGCISPVPGLLTAEVHNRCIFPVPDLCAGTGAWAASHSVSGLSAAEVHELKAIRDALAAIAPIKAIWKLHPTDLISLEERNVSLDIPANVMVTHFAPLNSLLGHPKMRAFLTQGGTNSFLEASCSLHVASATAFAISTALAATWRPL